jgi:hypothetical protein
MTSTMPVGAPRSARWTIREVARAPGRRRPPPASIARARCLQFAMWRIPRSPEATLSKVRLS